MSITTEADGERQIISMSGKLDSTNAPEAERAVMGALAEGSLKVVLDLAGLEYVSSAGLRVVLMAVKRLKAAGGQLILCSVQPGVKEILDIAGFTAVLSLSPDRPQALAAMG
ncbi:Anti-sigma factor antagonist [Candidatus Terasakiella magnetica]|nr:Anti-sigma factor antagonist [Candidatus Terasakiella magnetica]